jgi:uncharacterized protein (UPF0335 family)
MTAGHNHVAGDQLRLFLERIERLHEEKQVLTDDIKDVFGEAKANGYDTKTMRRVLAQRKLDANVRAEQEALFETYMKALGLWD